MVIDQCLKRARREKTIENPITTEEIGVEKPTPVSIEGAGDGAVSDARGVARDGVTWEPKGTVAPAGSKKNARIAIKS